MNIENDKLAIGDKVRLNSGGPIMTVISFDAYTSYVKCCWFNNNNDYRTEVFHSITIQYSDDEVVK